jgi:hypothetical protein
MCEIPWQTPFNNEYTLLENEGQERKAGPVWG